MEEESARKLAVLLHAGRRGPGTQENLDGLTDDWRRADLERAFEEVLEEGQDERETRRDALRDSCG